MDFYTNVQLLGDTILYCGYSNGDRVVHRDKMSPTLFVPSNKKTKYKTLDDQYVSPVKFTSVREARNFISKYQDVENFDVCGYDRFLYQYISDRFPDEEIKYDTSNIRSIVVDIETTSENGFPNVEETIEEILCITVKDAVTKKIITWGQREYTNTRKDVTYIDCMNEEKLLRAFMSWWVENTPDVVTGWNIKLFDIPYIFRRVDRVLGGKWASSLSPWNKVDYNEIAIHGKKNIYYNILGVSVLDYIDLYRKFTYTNQESYSLDHIGSVELDVPKLDHSEFDTFKEFYTKDWQKFIDYNIHDVEIVDKLEEKMKLLELVFTLAYDAKVNYEDVYSQVKTWDTIIFNFLKKDNIIVPPKKEHRKDSQYAGAYVKEPIPGMYDWVVNFDLNSLYPHLIMQYNISPETLLPQKHPSVNVDKLLNQTIDLSDLDSCTVCANGAMYSTHKQGFLPKLMEKIYTDRVLYKKKQLELEDEYEKTKNPQLKKEIAKYQNFQMARKIQLNSAYGAIGNEYFRYFRIENAEAITLSGQVSIQWIEVKLNKYLNKVLKTKDVDYVIAMDTDSIYLNMGPLVETLFKGRETTNEKIVSFLDKLCKVELEPYIESSYQELATYVNAYAQMMKMKRENIADTGIWTAKKRYILNVWDKEGVRYSKPKMKIMGLETARSSTPAYFRDKLEKAFKVIMTGDNDKLIEFIDLVRTETKKQTVKDISSPRGVNNLAKYSSSSDLYKKGTPIHVRGAILYNHYLKKLKINNKYPLIQEGEKIKFVYLKTPNPIGENVIAYFQEFPKELGLDKYVDYDLQFEKSFLEPLRSVLDCIGWMVEKKGSLESFFI
jgi:DNA polymerase elongation subunit (family B)